MEWELVESRTISGKGVLKVPADKDKNRAYILYSNIKRMPQNKYVTKNWNPEKSWYAALTFLYKDYVLDTDVVEFDGQMFTGVNDISGQTLIALKCAYEGLLVSLQRMSAFIIASNPVLAATVSIEPYTDTIKDYENLRLSWDEVRINCYSSTAIEFKLYRLEYDKCDPEKDKDKPPPPPPEKPPKTPPDEPVEVSDPYDDTTNDNDNTSPYILDKPEEEEDYPKGEDCEVWYVKIRTFSDVNDPFDFDSRVYAPILGYGYNPSVQAFFCICKGEPNSGQPCGHQDYALLAILGDYNGNYEVLEERPE